MWDSQSYYSSYSWTLSHSRVNPFQQNCSSKSRLRSTIGHCKICLARKMLQGYGRKVGTCFLPPMNQITPVNQMRLRIDLCQMAAFFFSCTRQEWSNRGCKKGLKMGEMFGQSTSYLVGGWAYPSEKWWSESHLGWWNSQLNGKL